MRRFSMVHASILVGLLAVNSCGDTHETSASSPTREEDAATIAANSSIAVDGDEDLAHIIVQMPADYDDVKLCIGAMADCQSTTAKLIGLSKTSPGYWRSDAPVDVRQDFLAHIVRPTSDRNEVIVSLNHEGISEESSTGDSPARDPSRIELPAPADLPKARMVPGVQIAYDYHGAISRAHPTAAVVRMIIQNGGLKGAQEVKVTGTLVNLRNSKIKIPLSRNVSVTNGAVIDFTVDQLSPSTVYRLEGAKVTATTNAPDKPAIVVAMRHPYHMATVDESKLSKARRKLVLRALAESYDWDHGNYMSSKGYASGSWCDRFYTWAVAKDFKLTHAYSAKSFFSQYRTLGNASRIPNLAKTKSVTGDLIRYEGTSQGTHTLMIIAYDEALKSIWTVEGNYNNRVMRLKRGLSSGWMHGHLIEAQAK